MSLNKQKPKSVLSQHHLNFGGPNFAPETFVHSPQSERPWTTLRTWQAWPGGVFCLCGEAGSGKSHLANIWASAAGATVIVGADLDMTLVQELIAMPSLIALVDDADKCNETALFSLLTALERQGGAVLLVSIAPPKYWPVDLPDLKSRLNSLAFDVMTSPEPDLLAKLIIRYAAATGFRIDVTASDYLAARIPRTFDAARDIVACMQEVDRSTLKSPKALVQRALHVLYTYDGYQDPETTPDLFEK